MSAKDTPKPSPQQSAWHFVGVGGVGMSGLAQVVRGQGARVTGSDRYLDLGQPHARLQKLRRLGVELFPQDGSGVTHATGRVVVSTAIEAGNPDLARAAALKLPTIHRSQLLADLFHAAAQRVAVTGSCGKTTVTAMIGWLLASAGLRPTIINGGVMRNFEQEGVGNAVSGAGDLCVIEADESDGTCVTYRPTLGVLTGLARDHKEADELKALYTQFAGRVEGTLVVNADDPAVSPLAQGRAALTYGFAAGAAVRAEDVVLGPEGCLFRVGDVSFRLPIIGLHNVHNALAALAVARALGVEAAARDAFASFRGVERRMERVPGAAAAVYDDFAHNPSKIAAAVSAARDGGARRVLAVFQLHGYGPARFMRDDLERSLALALGPEDRMWLLPIYYVGGTACRDISAEDIAAAAAHHGAPVSFSPREIIAERVAEAWRPGDAVVVMGARDDTLSDLARQVARAIEPRAQSIPQAEP